jgi:hypothetical protein
MASQPNPFADEPLPIGERLQSAASPLNPYAAPASVGEYSPTPAPGVGIWRDGPLLVMHEAAIFPNRCLITGEETPERRSQNVAWYYPIDWSTRTMRVEYALSTVARQQIRSRRTIASLISAAGALVLLIGLFGPAWILESIGGWGIFASIVGIVAGLSVVINAGRVLRFQKVRYPYFWLQGSQPPFLNSLPQWPGMSGG